VKKCKIKAITHFKVVKDGINWKPACDFLIVINTNWHPIYHCFGGLGTMYDVHLRLFGKCIVDFLLVLIELFSLCVTAGVLWAKIDRKLAICKRVGHHPPNFRIERTSPTNHFCTANECLTVLSLTVFTQRNFVADFLQAKCDFTWKTAILRFWAPVEGLRGNVQ